MALSNHAGEWGVFDSSGGLLEGGFYSSDDAKAAMASRYAEDAAHVDAVCGQHPERPAEFCEACN